MRKPLIAAIASLPFFVLPAAASADTSVGLRAGTLGGGIELSQALSQRLAIRIAVDGYDSYSRKGTQSSIEYDATAKLQTGSLLGDWFPFAGNFRISAGAMYNGNKVTLKGKPTGGTFVINGVTYQASDIGTLDGQVDFNTAAPYFGIGYGRPINGGLSLTFDLGVLFQGTPKSKLSATCGPATPAPTCSALQSDVAAQQAQMDESLSKFKYYPVVSLGLAYTF